MSSPIDPADAANKLYVDSAVSGSSGGVPASGGTFTGQVYLPNSFAATSGYSVCYINGDGRISRNASSLRFKKYVSKVDPLGLGNLFPDLARYQLRSIEGSKGDGTWRYGHIAEWLHDDPDLQRFVIYETEDDGVTLKVDSFGIPVPLTLDFFGLILAQTAALKAMHDSYAATISRLEDRLEALERITAS